MPSAFVIIHCEPTYTDYIVRNLKHFKEIKAADGVFGYYEVVCKAEAPTQRELEHTITNKVRRVEHVISTMTLTVIEGQNG